MLGLPHQRSTRRAALASTTHLPCSRRDLHTITVLANELGNRLTYKAASTVAGGLRSSCLWIKFSEYLSKIRKKLYDIKSHKHKNLSSRVENLRHFANWKCVTCSKGVSSCLNYIYILQLYRFICLYPRQQPQKKCLKVLCNKKYLWKCRQS